MKLAKTHAERVAASGVWKKRFALLPTSLDDGSVIWLEGYEEMEEYVTCYGMMSFWAKRKKGVVRVGTNSAGPGGPTSKDRETLFKGGPG